MTAPTHTSAAIGYRRYHRDTNMNFECNRWAESIGPDAVDEVAELAQRCTTYPQWIDGYLRLAETARANSRQLAAAYYDRAAGFFMAPTDPQRAAARARFVETMRAIFGVTPDEVPFGAGALPAYDVRPTNQTGTPVLLFGGFDSYVEEFLPMATAMADAGRRVVMFDGPGQGGALEEHGLMMMREWERPVAAVLDHYRLDQAAAVGLSLGGGLVIRAAAFEPRITRAVAFDVLDSFFEVVARQIGPAVGPALRLLLTLRMRRLLNTFAARATAVRPVSQWGLQQGMHVTGAASPYDFLRATLAFDTRKVSRHVTADVLLLAGTEDHFVPLRQLARQASALSSARSVTTRAFTAAEQAASHCQVGNIGLAARVITAWLDHTEPTGRAPDQRSQGASTPIFS